MKKTDDHSSAPDREPWDADARLTRAAAEGDTAAKRELLLRALPVVRRTARQILGRSQETDDAVQATLLEVLQSLGRFEGRSSLDTWVTRIAIRTTLRLAEKQRALFPVDVLESGPAAPSSRGALEGIPRPIAEYLDHLPPRQRAAVVLRHGLDFTVDEIAEATRTSRNTVKYRLKEALATIRRLVRRDLATRGRRHDD